jgi:hypothetical protein
MNGKVTRHALLAMTAGSLCFTAGAADAALRSIDEHRAVDPQGTIEVINVSGRIEVIGWDKDELGVTGTIGGETERVDISTSGTRTTVRVKTKGDGGGAWHFGLSIGSSHEAARLVVHVPKRNALAASLVSSDLSVSGIGGAQEIQTVSGDVTTVAQRDVRVHTVSGDLHLTAGAESKLLEIATVSGNVHVTGGGGDVNVSTVSGDASLELGLLGRATLKTVSGDFRVGLDLAADGRLDLGSVSGDVAINFHGAVPPAEFELKSFSGDLSTCFGPKPATETYGPGSHLRFTQGAGTARVHIDTKSGDVTLCTKK